MTNLDDFDNTTRSSWPLELSAPLSTPNALVPFRNNNSNILDAHPCSMSQSYLATKDSEPLGERETMTNASHQAAEQQAAVNAIEDHHSDVREGEALEASEVSYQRGSLSVSGTPGNTVDMMSNDAVGAVAQTTVESHSKGIALVTSPQQVKCTAMAALVNDKAVGMVNTTVKSTVVKGVIESNPAGKQPVDLYEQDTSYDSDMIASETRQTTLLTLQPGEQLSSTAIHEVISCVKPADCYVFDPLFFKNQSVFRFSNGFHIEDTITRILLPIHDSQRKHWYLAVLTISDSTIEIYDSMSCKEQSLSQSTHLESFAQLVKPQQQPWTVRLAECPQQDNGYDCGIYMIVNALQVMAQGSIPAFYDCATWRLLCRSLLGETFNNDQFNSLVGIADSKTNDFAPSDTQANDQDSWIIDTLERAVREAEICLRALQTKQAWLKSLHNASRSSLHTLMVLHERVRKEIDNLAEELQSQLRSHSDILKGYASSIMKTPESQPPNLQEALCSIRSTQTAMDTRLRRAERKAKSLKGNIERLSAATLTGQRIEEIWETKFQQAEIERQAKIQQIQSWREHLDSFSTQIAQLLAKHYSLEE